MYNGIESLVSWLFGSYPDHAVITIQRIYRGHRARKRLFYIKLLRENSLRRDTANPDDVLAEEVLFWKQQRALTKAKTRMIMRQNGVVETERKEAAFDKWRDKCQQIQARRGERT